MSDDYRGSYRREEVFDHAAPWVFRVARELEALISTIADFGIVIEIAEPDLDLDAITITVFDMRRRTHRTHEARHITRTYTQGFDPPLSPLEAAKLVALEVASSPAD
jgi:hypothetical protein